MDTFYGLQWYLALLHYTDAFGGAGVLFTGALLMGGGVAARYYVSPFMPRRHVFLAPLGVIVLGGALLFPLHHPGADSQFSQVGQTEFDDRVSTPHDLNDIANVFWAAGLVPTEAVASLTSSLGRECAPYSTVSCSDDASR